MIAKDDYCNGVEMNKLWQVLYDWNHCDSGDFDMKWNGYSELSDETGISETELKKIMKKLRDANIMRHSHTVNSDYEISGSGNFLTLPYENKTYCELVTVFEKAIKGADKCMI